MHHSEQVWQQTARALHRRRLRRRLGAAALAAAPLALVWLAWQAGRPPARPTPAKVVLSAPAASPNHPCLAVLVPDGPRFRLELWHVADLGEESLDLTLEPVVRALPPGDPAF